MIYTIDEIRTKIRPICEAYKVKKLWLFGSYARGEAREDSDVDIYAESGMGLLDLIAFRLDLEEALAKEVDIITRIPTEYPIFTKYIERDKVLLYEPQLERRTDPANHRAVL